MKINGIYLAFIFAMERLAFAFEMERQIDSPRIAFAFDFAMNMLGMHDPRK